MKRGMQTLAISLTVLCLTGLAFAKDKGSKAGPLSGTWECVSHGGPNGDLQFTLHLQQSGEDVTGDVDSPIGSAELSASTFKKNKLELHIDGGENKYLLTGTYKKGQLSGDWSTDSDMKGTWEGKKGAASPQP